MRPEIWTDMKSLLLTDHHVIWRMDTAHNEIIFLMALKETRMKSTAERTEKKKLPELLRQVQKRHLSSISNNNIIFSNILVALKLRCKINKL